MARYIRPRLGERRLGELSPVEIQALYGELLNRELSVRTICYTHAVLFSAMRQAVRWKFLLGEPWSLIQQRQPLRMTGPIRVS